MQICGAASDKSEYLVLDMEETCWEGQHVYVTVFCTLPMLLLYGVLVPSVITAILYLLG